MSFSVPAFKLIIYLSTYIPSLINWNNQIQILELSYLLSFPPFSPIPRSTPHHLTLPICKLNFHFFHTDLNSKIILLNFATLSTNNIWLTYSWFFFKWLIKYIFVLYTLFLFCTSSSWLSQQVTTLSIVSLSFIFLGYSSNWFFCCLLSYFCLNSLCKRHYYVKHTSFFKNISFS